MSAIIIYPGLINFDGKIPRLSLKKNVMLKKGMKPSHPGRILKNLYIDPLGLSQVETADNLGITRKTLYMLLNEHQGVNAEMALRLSKAFNTTPELWMTMQNNYDL